MTPLLLPATCILAVSEIDLEATPTGWREEGHYEVLAETRCPSIDVVVPDGGTLDVRATLRPSDGGRRRLGEARRHWLPRSVGMPAILRFETPDAIAGDAVVLDIVRTLPGGPYTWTPGANRGRYASLTSDVAFSWKGADVTEAWVSDAADLDVTVPSTVAARPTPTAAREAQGTYVQELHIPGDPQRSLFPGGGSSQTHHWTLNVPEGRIHLPLPTDAEPTWTGDVERVADGVLVAGQATLSWTTDDAPVFGVTPVVHGVDVEHRVQTDGRVRWEDDRWRLVSIDLKPITPDRAGLIRSLNSRFARAALPEPAVPVQLKGSTLDTGVQGLRSTLQRRAGITPLGDPLFPRKLVRARRAGGLTSVEAALILMLQIRQLGGSATWALVAPGPPEDASQSTPAGYTEGLVVVARPDGVAYVDPGCTTCAPFEVRPHLQGTAMLSPASETGPPRLPGTLEVVDADGRRQVDLTGPAALELRTWLSTIAKADRTAQLTASFAGDGSFEGASGLGTPGADISLVFTLGDHAPDPLWILSPDWIGTRSWSREGPPHRHAHGPGFSVEIEAGPTTRTVLTVDDPHAAMKSWRDAATALRPPSPAEGAAPGAPAP